MIPILGLCHVHNRFCNHDELMKGIHIIYTNNAPQRKSLFKRYANWNKIRIKFDYDYIDGTKPDPNMCTRIGQVIKNEEKDHTTMCGAISILSQTQVDALKTTFENLKVFLEDFLTVIPADHPYKIQNWSETTSFQPKTVSDVDLHITVVSRHIFPSSIIASANSHVKRSIDNFPEQGVIFVNPPYVPIKAQNIDSENSDYFYVLLHEVIHALGFSSENYHHFHSYDSMTRYKEPTCKLQKLGKNFTFLVTPYCHTWAMKHYGVEKFYGDDGTECLSGIEIEDNGNEKTVGSHLEGRVFFTDLMLGTRIEGVIRLTDATLAVLQDTGNFKCNYSMVQPLVWGNPESIDGNYIKDFATGPPQKVFPSGYLDNNNAGFDFSFLTYDNGANTKPDCSRDQHSDDDKKYCDGKEFYDPNDVGMGYDYFDYQTIKTPNNVCPYGTAVLPTMSSNVKCGAFKCYGYEKLFWNLTDTNGNEETIECNKATVGKNVSSITCPDPERFCRSVKLRESHFKDDPFNMDTVVLTDAKRPPKITDGDTPDITKTIYIIIGVVVPCVVLAIVIISVIVYCKVKKGKATNQDDNGADV